MPVSEKIRPDHCCHCQKSGASSLAGMPAKACCVFDTPCFTNVSLRHAVEHSLCPVPDHAPDKAMNSTTPECCFICDDCKKNVRNDHRSLHEMWCGVQPPPVTYL
ncbi:MAG: hypothetical protein AAB965_00575 [Patescibacteria group bacterium]